MHAVVSPLEVARRRRGLTQRALATHAGVSRDTISRIERGYPPTLATARALATALDVDIDAIDPKAKEPRSFIGARGSAQALVQILRWELDARLGIDTDDLPEELLTAICATVETGILFGYNAALNGQAPDRHPGLEQDLRSAEEAGCHASG